MESMFLEVNKNNYMRNLNEMKIELLKSIDRLCMAIDNEVDWFLVSSSEKDLKRKSFAKNMFIEKQKETRQIAKEEYERFK